MKRNVKTALNALFIALLLINIAGCDDTTPSTPNAKKYKITFDAAGGTLAGPATVNVEIGKTLAKPQNPARAGFSFTLWQKADGTAFDFTTETITADITLTANWSANAGTTTYTVTFNPNGGMLTGNATAELAEGENLAQPQDPTRARFVFTEWQNLDGTAFDFTTETITADITLTASWRSFNTVTAVSLMANAMDDRYTVAYTYTNNAGTDTGGTPEITWFISDNPDGSDSTQVSTETTYTPMGADRYKYLSAAIRVMDAEGGFTAAVISKPVFPGFSKQASGNIFRFSGQGRSSHTSVVFQDRMWVIGGGSQGFFLDDVWSSPDGITWTRVRTTRDDAGFMDRAEHTSVVFMDSIRVIGGQGTNDVWSSADGITWTLTTAAGRQFMPARSAHTSVVFQNRMWVIGGFASIYLNDVWSSPDGITWTQATADAGFTGRTDHTSVVLNNRMWVIGGFDRNNYLNDVWSSADGITWREVTADAGFMGRSDHTSVVFDNRMWVIGGFDGNPLNDVWSSADGITWREVTADAGFTDRSAHTSVVFDNRMWVISGLNGQLNLLNDVWY